MIVGSPNVGKSLLFNRLTGAYVSVSNYPGTTVALDTGKFKFDGKEYGVIDSPGMYSLLSITEEERVAKELLFNEDTEIVLHVIDAKNLERSLPFTLQLTEAGLPVIAVLNMMDEAESLGFEVDLEYLEERLGVPFVSMVATTGRGVEELKERIRGSQRQGRKGIRYGKTAEVSIGNITSRLSGSYPVSERAVSLLMLQRDEETEELVKENEGAGYRGIEREVERAEERYNRPMSYIVRMRLKREAGDIVSEAVRKRSSDKTGFRERLSRVTIRPLTGIPILLLILYFGLYQFVGVFGAGTVVDFIEGPLFGERVIPATTQFVNDIVPWGPVRELFVGEYGVISLGVTYAIAIILPIVGTFFLVFSVIEDTGYLPRLALLIDRVFKRIGLSGRAVIPMVLGLGCDTMATMVTRTQETKRERVIATLLLALAVPCSAQLGVIFAILAGRRLALLIWFVVILFNFVLIGFLASKILPGKKPSFYMELPPLRLPKISNVLTKTYTRMVWYFKEIFPLFILASFLIWVFRLMGLFQLIIDGLEPVVNLLGLPDAASKVFLFGFFRRDYGAAGLFEMQNALTGNQLVVAAVTLTLFVPCVAQFMIMIKERGTKTALLMFFFVLFYAFLVGMILNQILSVLGVSL